MAGRGRREGGGDAKQPGAAWPGRGSDGSRDGMGEDTVAEWRGRDERKLGGDGGLDGRERAGEK